MLFDMVYFEQYDINNPKQKCFEINLKFYLIIKGKISSVILCEICIFNRNSQQKRIYKHQNKINLNKRLTLRGL